MDDDFDAAKAYALELSEILDRTISIWSFRTTALRPSGR